MQTIDFINKIGYKINEFPDGEKQLVLNELNRKEPVRVVCRVKSSDDLFLLMQLADILGRQEVVVDRLCITYLMGMRNDRVISYDASYTLKVISNAINSLNAKEVVVFESHSARTLELIKNSKNVYEPIVIDLPHPDHTTCYPDKGAAVRSGKPALSCTKERDLDDGTLLNFKIVNPDFFSGGTIVVKDDLCDGGGTFVGIAEKLRELRPSKLVLVVTHAIQKQGIEKVAQAYDEVYITNSYSDWQDIVLPENVFVQSLSI